VLGVAKDTQPGPSHDRHLAVDGMLADVLRKELARGGRDSAVRLGGPEGAAAYIRVVGEQVSEEDEAAIRRARRARVPVILVSGSDRRIPHVLATDVVRLAPGSGFPVEQIASALARRLGEDATGLAARLPVLRGPVCEHLIRTFARKNTLAGVAVFITGTDMPLLTLNQVRLVLRIAAAHGANSGSERLPEVLGTVAAGFGFRGLARRALGVLPTAGWIVKGAVAYAGTRAVGEAAVLRFGAASSGGSDAMRRPGAAWRGAS
jgi:uncharacterized protein (DUF697 family)